MGVALPTGQYDPTGHNRDVVDGDDEFDVALGFAVPDGQ